MPFSILKLVTLLESVTKSVSDLFQTVTILVTILNNNDLLVTLLESVTNGHCF